MKHRIWILCFIVLLAGCAAVPPAEGGNGWVVGSRWQITIEDAGKPPQVVTLQVTDDEADSCMGGDWKRLKRVGGNYDRLSEPAYELSADGLKILLSSNICDAYDSLDVSLEDGRFTARHSAFGITGGNDVGKANAVRVR